MTRTYIKHGLTGTPEYWKQKRSQYDRENPHLREQRLARLRLLNAKRTPRQALEASLRFHYGLSMEGYDCLLLAQEGRCAICLRETPRLDVDHDHTTGQVRGLLCRACNMALGWAGDSVEGLQKAISYLKGGDRCP